MSQWEHIASLVETGQRLSFDEALTLWQQAPLWQLSSLALNAKRRISGDKVSVMFADGSMDCVVENVRLSS